MKLNRWQRGLLFLVGLCIGLGLAALLERC